MFLSASPASPPRANKVGKPIQVFSFARSIFFCQPRQEGGEGWGKREIHREDDPRCWGLARYPSSEPPYAPAGRWSWMDGWVDGLGASGWPDLHTTFLTTTVAYYNTPPSLSSTLRAFSYPPFSFPHEYFVQPFSSSHLRLLVCKLVSPCFLGTSRLRHLPHLISYYYSFSIPPRTSLVSLSALHRGS